jgi:protein-S-isoprenylcysteine O-methyltransferase Ste14
MMNRLSAGLGSALFFFIGPGIVAGLVPWWISRWRVEAWFLNVGAVRGAGTILIAGGLVVLLDCFARFALQGRGTPAPLVPTRHLVITGPYRYVRNPMYLAIVSIILGQGLFWANARLLEYGAIVWLVSHLFVLLYEEPKLRKSFGTEYEAFCSNVPRWLPRLHPWNPQGE